MTQYNTLHYREHFVVPHLENGGGNFSIEEGADFALKIFNESATGQSESVEIDEGSSVRRRQHLRNRLHS